MKMISITPNQARLALSALESLQDGLAASESHDVSREDLREIRELIEYLRAETRDGG